MTDAETGSQSCGHIAPDALTLSDYRDHPRAQSLSHVCKSNSPQSLRYSRRISAAVLTTLCSAMEWVNVLASTLPTLTASKLVTMYC